MRRAEKDRGGTRIFKGGGGEESLGQGYQLRHVLREETYTAAILRAPIALETIYALHSSKIFFSEKPTWFFRISCNLTYFIYNCI